MCGENSIPVFITSKGSKQAYKKAENQHSKRQKTGSKGNLPALCLIIKVSPPPPWFFLSILLPPYFQNIPRLVNPSPTPCWYCDQSFKKAETVYEDIEAGVAVVLVAIFQGTSREKLFFTDCLSIFTIDADEVNMDVQKCSGFKYTSGPLQCKSSHFSSISKTTFILHGLRILFANQKHPPFIIKFLPTNVIKVPKTIWRRDKVQGCHFIIIR